MQTITAALVQERDQGSVENNLATIRKRVGEAVAAGASLILLQELHNGPYFCQREDPANFERAEPVPGPTTNALGELAAQHEVVIVGSVFERRAAGVYHNTAVILERDGSLAGRYRKAHIPDDPGYHEKFYFTPGDGDFSPVETSVGRLGVLVCWDQWFPEAARLMSLAGADLLLYPTAIGSTPDEDGAERARQLDAWRTIQRAHAVANGLPVLVTNRVGHESAPDGQGGIDFWGRSFMAGPQGEILAASEDAQAGLVVGRIEPGHSESVRRMWPFFRDRRIDAYEPLLRRWRD